MDLPEKIEEWIDAYLYKEFNDQESELLQIWLKEKPEHQQYFKEYCKIWYIGKCAGDWERLNPEKGWMKTVRKYQRRRKQHWIGWVSSIASMVGLFVGIAWWFINDQPHRSPQSVYLSSDHRQAQLRLASGHTIDLGQPLLQEIQESGARICMDSVTLSYTETSISPQKQTFNELSTPRGGEFEIRLSDGSRVFMNAESKLRYPVKFMETIREVWLEGEAWFDIKKNPDCPFIVHTSETGITVLGTEFTVSAYPQEEITQITLVNGKVNIEANGKKTVLNPDQQFTFDRNTKIQEVKTVDAALSIAWKEGVLNFKSLPLTKLTQRLARWYDVDFIFENPELGQLEFSGAFKKYNELRYILNIIEKTTEVKFKMQGKTIIVKAL
ncbi:MAG: FecR family protein [Odoribacter splanchnicus]